MKTFEIKVTGYVDVEAEDEDKAVDALDKRIEKGLRVADLTCVTLETTGVVGGEDA